MRERGSDFDALSLFFFSSLLILILRHRSLRFFGRDDLETLLASTSAADWVKITEMILGPPPSNFVFVPKHKSNAYENVESRGEDDENNG